jgi:superfamily II DNA or RNA helicase
LSGKGFGNLIALPFNKTSIENGNCCFIDPETLAPISDQQTFINVIKRISIPELERLYADTSKINVSHNVEETLADHGKTIIRLKENVYINRNSLPLPFVNFLKNELNFSNTEFFIRKNLGKSIHETKRYFKLIQENGNNLIIPRGFIGRIIRFCKDNKIEFDFKDERKRLAVIEYSSTISLYEYQQNALEATNKKDFGVIVAPPGTGKTIIGLKIIAEKSQPALILVHRKQLADQWIERIQTFLGIPKHQIGFIGQGRRKLGKMITVAMIQSMGKEIGKNDTTDITSEFGTIIVDECHHVPAETYNTIVSKLHCYYIYGLTATPFRKYNDGKLIFVYLGDIISEIKTQEIANQKKTIIVIRNTELNVPFNSRTDRFETLSNILIHDSARNKLILNDVISEINTGKRAVIITERKEHIESLCQFLKQKYEVIALSGEDSEKSRKGKWENLKEGNYQILVTTGQYFGEGTDLKNAECLFLAYPFSFEGKLIQYIGRVQRGEVVPWIYDYRDAKVEYLNRLFLKRNAYYRKLERQASLFDDTGIEITTNWTTINIDERIKVTIDDLEFRYGSIAFNFHVDKMSTTLEFEIDNYEIRPEFDVLKPYFAKVLRTKTVEIEINAEFNEGKLISQIARSKELDKINNEIIDTVRFRFVEKNFFGKIPGKDKGLLDLSQLQNLNNDETGLYDSESEFLEDILKHKQVRHYKQLRFLAEKHEASIMKIRFVLSPFSFVYLLAGEEQFHVVMETMDTEEATYIWHTEKSLIHLKQQLSEIDADLNFIRNDGRQSFLEKWPKNFSRVLHDYSDEKKGFIFWKSLVVEKLV